MLSVGIIGLGKMGLGIAENLLKAGFLKALYKRTPDPELFEKFQKENVYIAKSPKDLAEHVDVVLLSVPNESVKEIVFGSDLADALKPNSIIIDTGNCDPRQSIEIYEKLKTRNIHFLDVGVSGGPSRAKAGTLAVWAGGEKEIYDRVLQILQAIGKPTYIGSSGCGHKIKMLHNVMEQIEMQGIAEVANAALKFEFDPQQIFKTIREGLTQSHLSNLFTAIPRDEIVSREAVVEGGDYPRMALEIGKEMDIPLPEVAVSYWVRVISRASEEERDKVIEQAIKAVSEELRKLKDKEKFKFGFQTLGALRHAFGGHK
ncbi:MAG: NAD(P)-dependent oxidoreductase [Candidatus Aenigmatarchaeota archaeon]|nr:NAD(P)-dependent oxidoreductase [Candidatus Aenigmarchaeota archaeon]